MNLICRFSFYIFPFIANLQPKEATEDVSDQDADNDDDGDFQDEGEEDEQPDEESEEFEVGNPSEESGIAPKVETNGSE